MHSKEGEKAILNWVRTLAKPGSIDQLDQLADGAVMASILNRFVNRKTSKKLKLIKSRRRFLLRRSLCEAADGDECG